jgi:BirA family biotin operon repressor/biotin-[acetyl-CoA-carboxylase] ligase
LSDDVIATRWEGAAAEAWRSLWRLPSLVILDSTPSSNDVAMRLAADGAPAGTTVIADRQTRGRGREGRPWSDTPGLSLLLSVVLRADEATDPSTVPLRVGLAVARAIEDATAAGALIKWPNDVLAKDGRKVAGILCEGASGSGSAWIVAGIGINVSQNPGHFGPELSGAAASLAMIGAPAQRATLAGRILDGLRPFRIVPPPLDGATLRALADRDALRGRQVTVNGDVACTADGIAPDGALRLKRNGEMIELRSGTVRLQDGATEATHSPMPGQNDTAQWTGR